MADLILTTQEAQTFINYLATKPYQEVFQLINLLQSKALQSKAQQTNVVKPLRAEESKLNKPKK